MACGSVEHFDDANNGTIDGPTSPDAEATVGTANVTTYALFGAAPNTPLAGIDVVVVGADGTQRDLQMSDATGHATVAIHTGDSVTAIYRDVSRNTLITFDAAKPNDNIVYGLGSLSSEGSSTGSANVSVILNGASYYYVYSACNSVYLDPTAPTGTMQFYDYCPANAPLVYLAYDSTGTLINWARVPNTNTTQNTTVVPPAWQSPVGFTISGNGIPPEVTNVSANVLDLMGGTGNYTVSTGYNGAPVNGAFTTTIPFIGGPAAGFSTQISYFRDNSYGQQIAFGALPQNAVAFATNNPSLLPWLGLLSFDTATNTVSVSEDGAGSGNDTTLFDVSYNRTFTDGGSQSTEWLVIAGPTTTSFHLPPLPGADASLAPQPTDQISPYNSSLIVDYPDATTYDQVRAMPLGDILALFQAAVPGTRVATSAQQNQGKMHDAPRSLLSRPTATEVHR